MTSPDGTPVAVFASGPAGDGRPALLLVHGTSADHRTWRVCGPRLARRRRVLAMDRRGRGASGDAPGWAIERELEDVAAVAEAFAADAGGPVDVVGHSLGGGIALAASCLTPAIRRVVVYEGAPGLERRTGDLVARLRARLDAGDLDGLLATFMAEAVGMPAADLAAFRVDPIWPLRAAAGPTIVRELEDVDAPAIGSRRSRPSPSRSCSSSDRHRRGGSATARPPSTPALPTAASRSSRAPATPPTTATRPSSRPVSRRSSTAESWPS